MTIQPEGFIQSSPLVVGIGASAGGVEALRGFFTAVVPGGGMAFIVYLHFPPHGISHLVRILAHCTILPVTTAIHGETILPDHVYVIPPGMTAALAGGSVSLGDIDHIRNPIDKIFCSLASECGRRAIGVVLSGTGTDGAQGIEAISARGGLTIAQGNGGAGSHPEMPANAIATGLVDHVLRVEEMPAKLAAYGKSLMSGAEVSRAEIAPHRLKGVKASLCELLQNATRHDFSRYKVSTFLRRVERRMRVLKIVDWNAYVDHACASSEEVTSLFRDLLIGVTAFFRDADAFQVLATTVIPRLFAGKGPQDKVRVWVPGCASGEEAYSIAMLLCEHATFLASPPQIQVFGTDVDDEALRIARSGRYPASALEGMTKDRIDNFFIRDGANFIANKKLRATCTFAAHSVIRDPPLCFVVSLSRRHRFA